MSGVKLERFQRGGVWHPLHPLMVHDGVDPVPLRGYGLEDSPDEAEAGFRHVGRHVVRALEDALLQLGHSLCPKWHGAGHHEVEKHPQGPDVHIHAHVVLVSEEFGRSVGWGPTERVQHLPFPTHCAEPKIAHLHTGVAGVEHVFCFQVSVDNLVFMLWEETEGGMVISRVKYQQEICISSSETVR